MCRCLSKCLSSGWFRIVLRSTAVLLMLLVVGCGPEREFSEEEAKQKYQEEVAPVKDEIAELEAKLGPDHPEVKQMKMMVEQGGP